MLGGLVVVNAAAWSRKVSRYPSRSSFKNACDRGTATLNGQNNVPLYVSDMDAGRWGLRVRLYFYARVYFIGTCTAAFLPNQGLA